MTILITLTTAGADTGPFDLYSNANNYSLAFATNISKANLLAGYYSTAAPMGTTIVRVRSVGDCFNFIDILSEPEATTTTTTTTIIPCTGCDELYVWTPSLDLTYCYREDITAPTSPVESYVWFGTTYSGYSQLGTKLFDAGYNLNGTGSYTFLETSDVWKATTSLNGPMNRCSVWVNNIVPGIPLDTYNPLNTWIGFTHCISGLTANKTYYIGVGADNLYRLLLNGVLLLETTYVVPSSMETFQYWHVYPVTVNTSTVTLTIEGKNNELIGGFGVQIYDATRTQLINMASVSALNAVTIFSSDTKIGFVPDVGEGGYGYSCPEGYYYDECTQTCIATIICSE